MPTIIANTKAWAANAYISHVGEEVSTPAPRPQLGIYYMSNFSTTIELNENKYVLSRCQLYFSIQKNDEVIWRCNADPTAEFDELVNVSLPLWERYINGNKPYYLDKVSKELEKS